MYRIEIKKSAVKELSKLPTAEGLSLAEEINKLKEDPRPIGCVKLKGRKHIYRIRHGNYRVIYTIEDKILLIMVVKIGDRKEVY